METTQVLDLLLHGNQLKRTTRTGWVQRGIPNAESVAAHTFGVAFISLVMKEAISAPLDLKTVLMMAILHDLPEGLTSDIPTPAWRLMPPGTKPVVEAETMRKIAGDREIGSMLMAVWEALLANDSPEARLVHDCDKLDMYLQAFMYERQTGNQLLAEFWEREHKFEFDETQAVYHELASLRNLE